MCSPLIKEFEGRGFAAHVVHNIGVYIYAPMFFFLPKTLVCMYTSLYSSNNECLESIKHYYQCSKVECVFTNALAHKFHMINPTQKKVELVIGIKGTILYFPT